MSERTFPWIFAQCSLSTFSFLKPLVMVKASQISQPIQAEPRCFWERTWKMTVILRLKSVSQPRRHVMVSSAPCTSTSCFSTRPKLAKEREHVGHLTSPSSARGSIVPSSLDMI